MALIPFPDSTLLAYGGLIPLVAQAILLHPYYERSSRLIRMALLPCVLYPALAGIDKRTIVPTESYLHFNFGLIAIPTFHVVCLAAIFAFHVGPVFKSDEELGKTKAPESTTGVEKPDGEPKGLPEKVDSERVSANVTSAKTASEKPPSTGELTKFVLALLMSPRGLKCTWAPPESVVPLRPKMSVAEFVARTIVTIIAMHVWFLFICAVGVGSVTNPRGIYGFLIEEVGLPSSKLLEFASPYILTCILGGGAYSGFALPGCLFNLVEVVVQTTARTFLPKDNQFRPEPFDPVYCPPLFNDPWTRTSLSEFWGKGWQSVFRHHFLFLGAMPMYKILGRFGPAIGKLAAVMGAMMLSAAMHEFCLVSISKSDPSYASSKMFLAQGAGITLEAIYKRVTGRRVGGLLGWIWTFGMIVVCGQPMVDTWVKNGLGKTGVLRFEEWGKINCFVPFGPLITDEVYHYVFG